MILLSRLFLTIFLFTTGLFSQEYLKDQFEYSKKIFEEENYYDAITEFKRLKYFDENNVYEFTANEHIALSYKQGGKFNEAIQYFTIAGINAVNKEDHFRVKIEIIRTNILRRTTANALKLLDELSNDERWNDRIDEINYWRGWALMFTDEWESAATEFSKISPGHRLKILCEETHKKKYSVNFAKFASVVLPGAGQFYTGNYLSGLISLGWCTLWGYVAVDAFINERVFDGLAVANFLWFRFYRGNLHNAEKFAVEKNIEIANESLYYLQHIYTGEKP